MLQNNSVLVIVVTIKTRRSLLSTKGNKRGMMNACCVCVNAYVSGLVCNLELLGLMVLQSFHNWSKSLFIVPFCSNCHSSQNLIQAGRKQRMGKHKSQQTLLSHRYQDIYSQFSPQASCILFSLVCWHEHLLSPSLVNLTNSTAFNPFVYNLVLYCYSVQF